MDIKIDLNKNKKCRKELLIITKNRSKHFINIR